MVTLAAPGQGPGVEYFASSLDINFGGGVCGSGCSGAIVWAMAGGDTAKPKLSAKFVPTATYTLAPAASSPGNPFGIFTGGTNIQATPVYRGGVVTFTLTTGIMVAGAPHVAVYWAQVKPALTDTALTEATLVQQGLVTAGGDQDTPYGAPMVDSWAMS